MRLCHGASICSTSFCIDLNFDRVHSLNPAGTIIFQSASSDPLAPCDARTPTNCGAISCRMGNTRARPSLFKCNPAVFGVSLVATMSSPADDSTAACN